MTNVSRIGLDLAKNVFQVHGLDGSGNVVVRKQLRRSQVEPFFAKLSPVIVGIEACGARITGAACLGSLDTTCA
jgi:transposase